LPDGRIYRQVKLIRFYIITSIEDSPRPSASGAGQASPGKQKKKGAQDFGEEFEAIWNSYPSDKRGAKSKCYRNWEKLTDEEKKQIPGAIQNHIGPFQSGKRKDREWIKHLQLPQ
jgi:hypothetical protein